MVLPDVGWGDGWRLRTDSLFSDVSCEARVPRDHPLRAIRAIVDEALEALSPAFEKLHAPIGRPSIRLDSDLLFRWFVGLAMDAPIRDVTVITKNRERLRDGAVAAKFMAAVRGPAAGRSAAVGRPLLGRRHADRGLGQCYLAALRQAGSPD